MPLKLFLITALCMLAMGAHAITYEVPQPQDSVVGQEQSYEVSPTGTTTLEYVAAEFQQGLSNMIEANPRVDPIVPYRGTRLIIPSRLILPSSPRNGIVVNSPEMRLYYYHGSKVDVLPIGIGQPGKGTPTDWVTKVERKKAGPTWTPTANTRAEYAAMGEPLPAVVPAGPDNPMGLYALYVGRLYAIHGTNADFGIGLRVSHGCVRLRDDDIRYLFEQVPVGTRVQFINQPIKYTVEANGNIYIEVHQPLSRTVKDFERMEDHSFSFTPRDRQFFANPEIDQDLLARALDERSGRPVLLNPARF
ncbi:MAG: L,D-transpeptidase family protein [Succinivibrionaceae bacterium]|nr:L,D-transpeptidase family protein [Succinivibrionaceae bacterium]